MTTYDDLGRRLERLVGVDESAVEVALRVVLPSLSVVALR
jgi:hypothetical protein